MDWVHAVVLAVIQAVTEFLPISSSGHLILVPYLLGWPDQGLSYDIAVNTGTMLAVVVYLRRDVKEVVAGFFRTLARRRIGDDPGARMAWHLILATIPAGLAGLAFHDLVEHSARDPRVVAVNAILFGVILFIADRRGKRQRTLTSFSWKDALLFGVAQALALIPGTSRSGITMTAGLFSGFTRAECARFSFLMAVPVGVLAGLLDAVKLLTGPELVPGSLGGMVIGLVVSGISAYWVIDWLMGWLQKQTLTVFVIYRLLLGVAIFTLAL
ncbi:MAG: undecaprenyl-diphosphate phosphatase [Magnetococcales bacterium]|nr:undecaprenyl-diphosphate phosphatase [Magnetococcales bacterium]